MAILIDLEATCWDKKDRYKHELSEIIELSAIVIDDNFIMIDVFSEFIKPTREQTLSEFCTKLTGIEQNDVNNAKSFNDAMRFFENWTLKFKDNYNRFIAWGNYDQVLLRKNILANTENAANKYAFNKRFFNLQNKFEEIMYLKKGNCSLVKALSIIGESFQGREHSGLADVKNMLKVYKFVCLFDNVKYREENKLFIDNINDLRRNNLLNESKILKRS